MDKVKGITIIVIAVLSVFVTIIVANVLLDTTGKVNQGNFRISDIIIESTASLIEVQDKSAKVVKLSDIAFDINQTNNVSILLESNVELAEAAIENFKISKPELYGKLNICQKDQEIHEINDEFNTMPIFVEKKDGSYIIELCIDNDKVVMDKSVKEDTLEVPYDARIFKLLDVDADSLKFNVSFDLCLKDENGKVSRANVTLNMPTDETFTKGMSILRQDASKYVFTVLN